MDEKPKKIPEHVIVPRDLFNKIEVFISDVGLRRHSKWPMTQFQCHAHIVDIHRAIIEIEQHPWMVSRNSTESPF